jgi:hypothetical protein
MRVDWAKPQPVSVGGAQQQAGVDGVQVRVDGVQRRKKKRRCRRRSKEKGRWTWLRARSQLARSKGWIMTNCLSRQRLAVMFISLYTKQPPELLRVNVSTCGL